MASGLRHRVVERLKTANGAQRRPPPDKIASQMAKLVDCAPDGDEWLHEIEYDGYRATILICNGKATILGRDGVEWTCRFPALARAASRLPVADAILDGEIVHLLPDGRTEFGRLQDDIAGQKTEAAVFYAFDLLYLDGWDLTSATLHDRKCLLEPIVPVKGHSLIRYASHNIGSGPDYLLVAKSMKLDGIVSKLRSAPYRAGCDGSWRKVKCANRQDMIVIGTTGEVADGSGSLLLGYRTTTDGALAYAGKAAMPASSVAGRQLCELVTNLPAEPASIVPPEGAKLGSVRWVRPEVVVETRFRGWALDGTMRKPTILGVREDKRADEVLFDWHSDGESNVIELCMLSAGQNASRRPSKKGRAIPKKDAH